MIQAPTAAVITGTASNGVPTSAWCAAHTIGMDHGMQEPSPKPAARLVMTRIASVNPIPAR